MRQIRLIRFFIIVFVIMAGIFTGCSHDDVRQDGFIRDLGAATANLKTGQELRMDSINKGAWDKMFVFAPYTPLSELEKAINIKSTSQIEKARIYERDDINLLIFLSNSDIQLVAAIPRNVVDFSIPKEVQPLYRNTAIFKKEDSGNTLLYSAQKTNIR